MRFTRLRDLARELIARDLKLRYKRSLLGITWSLVTPLSLLLVLSFVFTAVLPLDIPDYASFLFVGILVWSWFHNALDQSTGAIVDNRELVRQAGFPVAILPVVTVAANLVHFALALPVLALVLALGDATPGASLLLLPVLIAIQFLFTLSLAYFLATLHVTFRDTKHLLGILLTLGFYVTPIFYSRQQAPERFHYVFQLNPMASLVESYRDVMLTGSWPDLSALGTVALVSVILLTLGYRRFVRSSHRFADEL